MDLLDVIETSVKLWTCLVVATEYKSCPYYLAGASTNVKVEGSLIGFFSN